MTVRSSINITYIIVILLIINVAVSSSAILYLNDVSDRIGALLPKGDLLIGAYGPMTGPMAAYGQYMKDGASLAVKDWNEKGGVLGRDVKIVWEDDKNKMGEGVAAVERLITVHNVVAIGGAYSSSISLATMDVAAKYKVPFVIMGGTSSEISKKIYSDLNKYFCIFHTMVNGTSEAIVFAEGINYLVTSGTYTPPTKKYAMVSEDSDFGRDAGSQFMQRIAKYGWQNVSVQWTQMGATDYYSELTVVRGIKPDLVCFVSSSLPAGVAFTRQFKELEVPSVLAVKYVPTLPDYRQQLGADAEYIVWTISSAILSPRSDEFTRKYMNEYGREPSQTDGMYYDGMNVLLDAIQRAGSTDSDKIVDALKKTDYSGPLGRYVFGSDHEVLAGEKFLSGVLFQIINGTNYALWPPDVKSRSFVLPPWVT